MSFTFEECFQLMSGTQEPSALSPMMMQGAAQSVIGE
jgi:hypothetical protein